MSTPGERESQGNQDFRHYGIAQWVDFARGVAPESEAGPMRHHLAEGCTECTQLATFCKNVSTTSRDLPAYEVPDSVLKNALAIFPVQFPESPKGVIRVAAELIFDSFLVPAPAGFRASWQIGWQALYRAGDCSLDLRIEPELHSSRAAVIGQVSNHELPDVQMSGVPVRLKWGKLVVAETRSNQFGEFQMEYEQQSRLQLCVYLDGGTRCIQVPLKKFAADRPAATDRLHLGKVERKGRPDPEKQ
jgi:hypothetical protein